MAWLLRGATGSTEGVLELSGEDTSSGRSPGKDRKPALFTSGEQLA